MIPERLFPKVLAATKKPDMTKKEIIKKLLVYYSKKHENNLEYLIRINNFYRVLLCKDRLVIGASVISRRVAVSPWRLAWRVVNEDSAARWEHSLLVTRRVASFCVIRDVVTREILNSPELNACLIGLNDERSIVPNMLPGFQYQGNVHFVFF